ncbi:MAG: transketolase C-terminal domain-containing protein, partial [Bacteroidaceae bacterium]
QRAYDNIIHDVAIDKLHVVFCLDRAGIVGEDGPTHHGMFDMAALRPIPNLTIASPLNERELRCLMYTAQLPGAGPFVIRYPRGNGVLTDWRCPLEPLPVGKGQMLSDGHDAALLTIGPLGNTAAEAVAMLKEEGISVCHYDMRFLKPIDTAILHDVATRFKHVFTVEDGVRDGGLGSAVCEYMHDHRHSVCVHRMGMPDHFVEHGTPAELYHLIGLNKEAIAEKIRSEIKH